jgi:hypothetical protein
VPAGILLLPMNPLSGEVAAPEDPRAVRMAFRQDSRPDR